MSIKARKLRGVIMNKFLVVALSLTIGSTAVLAADMPVKAPPRQQLIGAYPYETGGAYFGVGTFAETEKINTPIGGDTFAAGASITGTVGYTKPLTPRSWIAVEGQFAYANTGTNGTCGVGVACAVSSKLSGELLAKYGGNLSDLGGIIPNIGNVFPTLPTLNGINSTIHPYIGAGVLIAKDQLDALGLGDNKVRARGIARVGFLTQKDNGTVIDTWAEWSPKPGAGLAIPTASADPGTRFRVGLTAFWGLTR